jgi:hypothetical protein
MKGGEKIMKVISVLTKDGQFTQELMEDKDVIELKIGNVVTYIKIDDAKLTNII